GEAVKSGSVTGIVTLSVSPRAPMNRTYAVGPPAIPPAAPPVTESTTSLASIPVRTSSDTAAGTKLKPFTGGMLPLNVPLSPSMLGYGVVGSSTVPSSPSATAVTLVWLTFVPRSEEHTSELQSLAYLVCRLLL